MYKYYGGEKEQQPKYLLLPLLRLLKCKWKEVRGNEMTVMRRIDQIESMVMIYQKMIESLVGIRVVVVVATIIMMTIVQRRRGNGANEQERPKSGIIVVVDIVVQGRHHPPHHRHPPTRQHRQGRHRLDHQTVIIRVIVARIIMMIGSQRDYIIAVIVIVLKMIALLVRRNTMTVDGRGKWIRKIQVGITTLIIHRAMVIVNQQEAVVGATVLGGIGRQRAEEATMSMIIAIATNMTMTDTTIPILMQDEVTQLAIMTATILMTSIRVENLMESEDSVLWVRRCLIQLQFFPAAESEGSVAAGGRE
jgi:hypothetical protein